MIHLNIGSNLNSKFGTKIDNINIAIRLLIESKVLFKKNVFELLKIIKLIENKIGRKKTKKNSPRVIDIDIIDFNGLVIDSSDLHLPHPRAHLRNFVLYPILQIDPKWSHPILRKNAKFLINKLSQNSRIEITRLRKNVNISL